MMSHLAVLRTRFRSAGLRGLLSSLMRRTWRSLFAAETVLFYEWPARTENPGGSTTLAQIDSDLIGAAAIEYARDPAALQYLMRCAQRLHSGQGDGFALLTQEGTPVHFCWVKDFEDFEMTELDRTLHSPAKGAVLIFDCFTPVSARGQGYFTEAIAVLATQLSSQGKAPWIFGAATNQASLRGIEKSAFRYKFALGRRRILGVDKAEDSILPLNTAKAAGSRVS